MENSDRQNGSAKVKRGRPSPFWLAHDDELRQLWMTGLMSAREIAKALGQSKNAVLGRVFRLGLVRDEFWSNRNRAIAKERKQLPKAEFVERAAKREREKVARQNEARRVARKAVALAAGRTPRKLRLVAPTLQPLEPIMPQEQRRLTIGQLALRTCRMPLWPNDPVMGKRLNIPIAEKFYCGRPTAVGSPWCPQCREPLFSVIEPGKRRIREG